MKLDVREKGFAIWRGSGIKYWAANRRTSTTVTPRSVVLELLRIGRTCAAWHGGGLTPQCGGKGRERALGLREGREGSDSESVHFGVSRGLGHHRKRRLINLFWQPASALLRNRGKQRKTVIRQSTAAEDETGQNTRALGWVVGPETADCQPGIWQRGVTGSQMTEWNSIEQSNGLFGRSRTCCRGV